MNNTQNPLPSLKEAKEIASFINTPKNGQIILLNSVAPMQSASGIFIDKKIQEQNQEQLNRQGMLVVDSSSCDDLKDGDRVLLNQHSQFNVTRVITSSKLLNGLNLVVEEGVTNKIGKYSTMTPEVLSAFYRKYVVIVLHPTQIACTLS